MQLSTETLQRIESRITALLTSGANVVVNNQETKMGDEERIVNDLAVKAIHKKRVFIRDWCRILGVADLKFECTDEEWAYVTMPRDAEYIHRSIAYALEEDECNVFIDAFACVGGDTIAAMNQFKGAEVFAVQKGSSGEDIERFGRLRQNIDTCKTIIPNGKQTVSLSGLDIQSFLTNLSSGQEVSVLYLDPPWALGENPHLISKPLIINFFLKTKVWDPLKKKNIHPLLIVLKLPGKPTSPLIEEWPSVGVKYKQVALLTPRRKFSVYILRKVKPTVPSETV